MREESRELGRRLRRAVHVELPGEQQGGCLAGGECRAGGFWAEGALGSEEGDGFPVVGPAGRVVLLGRYVPTAVEERRDGLRVAARTGGEGLQGGVCGWEPRLVLPQPCEFAPHVPGDLDTDGPGAGADECELAEVLRVAGRVLRRDVRAGGVGEQVHSREPQVFAQGLDVVDQAVAAVGRGVRGYRGPAGAAQVQDDQLAVRRQSAEVAEVAGVGRTAGDAYDWVAVSEDTVAEQGAVRCVEGGHEVHPAIDNRVIQPGYGHGVQGV